MGSSILNENGSLFTYNSVTANRQYLNYPRTSRNVYIGSTSTVIGDVIIKSPVFIGFNNIIRADNESSFFIGSNTNIHDNCEIHGKSGRYVRIGNSNWAVYIDGEVSILHGSIINGYCRIGKNTFVGQMVTISNAQIKPNCVIMHGAKISGGIIIPERRFVKSGMNLFAQRDADNLPIVPLEYISLNPDTIKGYMELMSEYQSVPQTINK
jgi:carbonic anhydrase/acetyltransferase-like protein (isoleucine patch superfamily)